MYQLRQLQHQDLYAEAERTRATRAIAHERQVRICTRLVAWLPRLRAHWMRDAATGRAGSNASTRTI
jgi:hypothetical protein